MTRSYSKRLLLLCSSFTATAALLAQTIFIPDTNTQAMYNTWVPGCVDASGYLNTQDPGVLALDSGQYIVDWDNAVINGLDAFTNMVALDMSATPDSGGTYYYGGVLETLPSALQSLRIRGSLAIQPLEFPLGLSNLYIIQSNAATIQDFPVGLDTLYLGFMSELLAIPVLPETITTLELRELPLITVIPNIPTSAEWVSLVDLDVTSLPAFPTTPMGSVHLFGMPFVTELPVLPSDVGSYDVTGLTAVTTIDEFPVTCVSFTLISMPGLVSLPPFPAQCTTMRVENLSQLVSLPPFPAQCTNIRLQYIDQLVSIPDLPSSLGGATFRFLPNCMCLPYLPNSIGYLYLEGSGFTCLPNFPTNPDLLFYGDIDENELCSVLNSTCPTTHRAVAGKVFIDANANGSYDSGEEGLAGSTIQFSPTNITNGCDVNGDFDQGLNAGTYTFSATPSVPYFTSVSPAVRTATLVDTSDVDANNDFGVVLEPNVQDLQVFTVSTPQRPGFDNLVWLTYRNNGTMVMDGTVSFTFDTDQYWISSDPAPSSVTGNTAVWNFADLGVAVSKKITITMQTASTVNVGTEIEQTAIVGPTAGDEFVDDNTYVSISQVVGSYDPNDKTADPSELASNEFGVTPVAYTIRFQNTGNYLAEFVIISDTLSADLDWTSIHVGASSHPCTWFMHNGVLRFTFENIMLPDSTSDEPGSHGFVQFTIKTNSEPLSLPIVNVANIYFDYNIPVITEPALLDLVTGAEEEYAQGLRVFPNPVQDRLWVSIPTASLERMDLSVMDATGRIVMRGTGTAPLLEIDTSVLKAGAYLLVLTNSAQRVSHRFIKQ
ncbi:MAG: T9SS type A sorting domain-containing protein [Flavobacteriales bacterium]